MLKTQRIKRICVVLQRRRTLTKQSIVSRWKKYFKVARSESRIRPCIAGSAGAAVPPLVAISEPDIAVVDCFLSEREAMPAGVQFPANGARTD